MQDIDPVSASAPSKVPPRFQSNLFKEIQCILELNRTGNQFTFQEINAEKMSYNVINIEPDDLDYCQISTCT